MTRDFSDDPFVAEEIRMALQPYVHRLSAEDLAWMRAQLTELLAQDPEARTLLERAHPRGTVDRSGERLRPGLAEEPEGSEQAETG